MKAKFTKSGKKKTGRPKRDDIDRCQAAYWAWKIREECKLDFAKIERELNPKCALNKREDGGGFAQPQLWRRYGAGAVSPIGNGSTNKLKPNAVVLAEKLVPGSSNYFNSVLWRVLKKRSITISAAKKLCTELDPTVANCLQVHNPRAKSTFAAVLKLKEVGVKELVTLFHVDVLAVILIYMRFVPYLTHFTTIDNARTWIKKMAAFDRAFAKIEARLMSVLTTYESRFRWSETVIDMPSASQ